MFPFSSVASYSAGVVEPCSATVTTIYHNDNYSWTLYRDILVFQVVHPHVRSVGQSVRFCVTFSIVPAVTCSIHESCRNINGKWTAIRWFICDSTVRRLRSSWHCPVAYFHIFNLQFQSFAQHKGKIIFIKENKTRTLSQPVTSHCTATLLVH